MFYRRCVLKYKRYDCEYINTCYNGPPPLYPCYASCKDCRFNKCRTIGMQMQNETVPLLVAERYKCAAETIRDLIWNDDKRTNALKRQFSVDNPSLEEIVQSKGSCVQFVEQTKTHRLTPADWHFFFAYTTIVFLLNMDFMTGMEEKDIITLIQENTVKTSLLFCSFDAMNRKFPSIRTPRGQHVVPESVREMFEKDPRYLYETGNMLPNKFKELEVTYEEMLLITAIFFCESETSPLSEETQKLLELHHDKFSSALLNYCKCAHSDTFQTRFEQLLELREILKENLKRIEYIAITTRIKLKPTDYKKLFDHILL
ncbi:hypothetical protein GCK72_025857 [Caenorhabditis remanei]|uniref:NR LBD domain-containing protein n=1 Tax=Caenorhabditis remanei TaxID=31234 RepID=A0A6A5G4H6_CAERE|nr:hypothetical protein GCK72_025857 [Caenorhabditis remanei]KAF1749389.1 hypothetical protein GCK72_025857 [Caenorhabditis remanei]